MRTPVTTWWVAQGFTLVEMLVVLTMIGILTAIVLPTMVGLFTAGGDAQAYNALAGQLTAARSLAIQQRTHAGVHAQLADTSGRYTKGLVNTCFTAVVWHDPNDTSNPNRFVLAEGFAPQKLPSSMAFGRVDKTFYDQSAGQYTSTVASQPEEFTCLTFEFAPSGQLATRRDVTFPSNDPNHPAFDASQKDTRAYLWDPQVAEAARADPNYAELPNAAVLFDYSEFAALPQDDRPTYLAKYGQLIAINTYTGTPVGR